MSNGDKFNLSNLPPSNMLAPLGQNDQVAPNSSNQPLAATFGQQQQSHHHHHQQQIQFDVDHNQRQEALMSLFRSLSSLASSQQQQNQNQKAHNLTSTNLIESHGSCPVNIVNNTNTNIIQLATATHTNHGNACGHNAQPRPASSSSSTMTTAPNDSLASSIQSVVAAAVMQQQLARAALNNPPPSLHGTMPQPPHSFLQPPQPPHTITSQNNHQPASAVQFYNEQQFRPGINFVGSSQQTPFLGLEQNVQYPSMPIDSQQQQQQQRINYCTICNKELCNKYFMKTHMLKMHGINLEMEQSGENDEADCEDEANISMNDESADSKEIRNGNKVENKLNDDERSSSADIGSCISSSEKQRQLVTGEIQQNKKNTNRQLNATNKLEPTVSQASTNKKSSTGSNSSNIAKQATSVMNGFAGNSMGGVVCDICNKELCSKYFLKVHKQNTHGIMTDYQDASQFVYPFANALASSNPFMTAAAMSPMSIGAAGVGASVTSLYSETPMFDTNNRNQQHQKQSNHSFDFEPSKRSKKPRLTKEQRSDIPNSRIKVENIQVSDNCMTEMMSSSGSSTSAKPTDSLYRLMITQQQQQRQREPFSAGGQPQIVPQQSQPPFMPFDPMVANSMGALMCFGAMNPFGPAGISPTMIVEMILRNQHLFNRNNTQNQQRQQQTNKSGKDKNNNNNDPKQKMATKNSKDPAASDSRYFTHYTEACPMCDRRFKSIKWLKTHIMNDHKQEIGTYMQMMMQQLYSNKNQHLATTFDQAPCIPMNLNIGNQMQHQQQQQLQLHLQQNQVQQPQIARLQQQQQQQQHQQQHLLSIGSPMVPTSSTDHHSRVVQQQQQQHLNLNLVQDYLAQQKQVMQQGMLLDFTSTQPNSIRNQDLSIDACCRQEGLSPNNQSSLQALDDRSSNDQLDLSTKFSEAEQSSDTDINDYSIQMNAAQVYGSRSSNGNFLNNKNNDVYDDTDGGQDDDCSTKSSFQDEIDQRATNNNTSSSGNDLNLPQQIIKTTTTS